MTWFQKVKLWFQKMKLKFNGDKIILLIGTDRQGRAVFQRPDGSYYYALFFEHCIIHRTEYEQWNEYDAQEIKQALRDYESLSRSEESLLTLLRRRKY
jgi:hypothetical protein